MAFSSPAVGDVTGDGVPEIVTGGMDGCTRVITLNGAFLQTCLWDGGGAVQGSPALVDWNGDGVKDIIVTSATGGIYGWRAGGAVLFAWRTAGGVFGSPAIGDVDRDGLPDIAVATLGQYVVVYRHNGSELFANRIYDTSLSTPALADLDGDGRLEVIVGADMDEGNGANLPPYNLAPGGFLWAWHSDGTQVAGLPAPPVGPGDLVEPVGRRPQRRRQPRHRGRHRRELAQPRAHAVRGRSERQRAARAGRWPCPGPTMGSPAIADLDGDGRLDVAQQSGDGSIDYVARDGFRWEQLCNRSYGGCVPGRARRRTVGRRRQRRRHPGRRGAHRGEPAGLQRQARARARGRGVHPVHVGAGIAPDAVPLQQRHLHRRDRRGRRGPQQPARRR